MNKEPTVIIGGIAEIVRAIIPMLLIFGIIHWTDPQTGAVIFFVGVLVSSVEKLFIRAQTVPTVVADKQIDIAKASDERTANSLIIQQAKDSLK